MADCGDGLFDWSKLRDAPLTLGYAQTRHLVSFKLPPNVTLAAFDRALAAFGRVVGKEWVLATDEDRGTYEDIYALQGDESHEPAAAVAPASTEEVQAIVRLANAHKIPFWPISRGKNFGYGGSAPRMSGTVVLDLGRMRRILEVNERLAYCILEPGVGFYDLHEYLTSRKIRLWMSIPGNGWGSVIGNALERGFSATPYGDHTAQMCGMEVVLPSGDLVRTDMGAMTAAPPGLCSNMGSVLPRTRCSPSRASGS